MMLQPTIEEFTALQQDLKAVLSQQETLASQLRFVSHERDLLKAADQQDDAQDLRRQERSTRHRAEGHVLQ